MPSVGWLSKSSSALISLSFFEPSDDVEVGVAEISESGRMEWPKCQPEGRVERDAAAHDAAVWRKLVEKINYLRICRRSDDEVQ
jgi:hypothetical protein